MRFSFFGITNDPDQLRSLIETHHNKLLDLKKNTPPGHETLETLNRKITYLSNCMDVLGHDRGFQFVSLNNVSRYPKELKEKPLPATGISGMIGASSYTEKLIHKTVKVLANQNRLRPTEAQHAPTLDFNRF